MFTVANMTGILAAMIDQNALWSVLHDTNFGHTWMAHLAMSAAILGLIKARGSPPGNEHRDNYTPLLSGLLLASLAGVGHTQQNEGIEEFIHVGADAAHLLAAGAWLGGLLVLLYILLPSRSLAADQDLKEILHRFSGMGYVAVAGLIASGVINSWFLVGSFAALVETFYGQLLLVKLSLFVAMVFLAAANRFWLVPTLKRENHQQRVSLIKLRRHVLGEETLGL
jgi:putative copper resistance protein D